MDTLAKSPLNSQSSWPENVTFIGPDQLDFFWDHLWQSDFGQAWSTSSSGLAFWLKSALKNKPFAVSIPWNAPLQRRHFSQMWGQVFYRHYDNPAMADLYWVHELSHWAQAPLQGVTDFQAWCDQWDRNEIFASTVSEILIHSEIQGWDVAALGHPAWVSRFGDLRASQPIDPLNPHTWSDPLRMAVDRRQRLRDGLVAPECQDEQWLSNFSHSNQIWRDLWEPQWQNIDQGLRVYAQALATGSEHAVKNALFQAGHMSEFPQIPYLPQAIQFKEFYEKIIL